MSLGVEEFVRRFCLHVLPARFVKIRHYGLLANRGRAERLERARQLLGVASPAESNTTLELKTEENLAAESPARGCCPYCGRRTLVLLREVPPVRWNRILPVLDSS